ncbi:hypothetical protein ACJJTC_011285 [Scirpophaga incertulas]
MTRIQVKLEEMLQHTWSHTIDVEGERHSDKVRRVGRGGGRGGRRAGGRQAHRPALGHHHTVIGSAYQVTHNRRRRRAMLRQGAARWARRRARGDGVRAAARRTAPLSDTTIPLLVLLTRSHIIDVEGERCSDKVRRVGRGGGRGGRRAGGRQAHRPALGHYHTVIGSAYQTSKESDAQTRCGALGAAEGAGDGVRAAARRTAPLSDTTIPLLVLLTRSHIIDVEGERCSDKTSKESDAQTRCGALGAAEGAGDGVRAAARRTAPLSDTTIPLLVLLTRSHIIDVEGERCSDKVRRVGRGGGRGGRRAGGRQAHRPALGHHHTVIGSAYQVTHNRRRRRAMLRQGAARWARRRARGTACGRPPGAPPRSRTPPYRYWFCLPGHT